VLLALDFHLGFEWGCINRAEAVALLKELGAEHLLQSTSVLVEQRKPDRYQLCVKGSYDRCEIESFLKKYALNFEENTKGYLCIFKP
jgi:hypothetical protein